METISVKKEKEALRNIWLEYFCQISGNIRDQIAFAVKMGLRIEDFDRLTQLKGIENSSVIKRLRELILEEIKNNI